jgi:hypothetical protein
VRDARKHSNIRFSFVGDGGNEVGRFITRAAIDKVQALDAAHFFDFRTVYTDQRHDDFLNITTAPENSLKSGKVKQRKKNFVSLFSSFKGKSAYFLQRKKLTI